MAVADSRLVLLLLAVLTIAAAAVAYSPAAWMGELEGARYRVGGPDGWIAPPPEDKELYYVRWASSIAFHVGDSIEFVYKNDSVIRVTKAGYYHCNETAGIDAAGDASGPSDGVTVFRLDPPGFAYFASADLDRCNKGERVMINVLAAGPPAPAHASPSPAPSTDHATGAGFAFSASSFGPILAVAAMAMAGLV